MIVRSVHAGLVTPVKTDPEATGRPVAVEGQVIDRLDPPVAAPTDQEDGMSGLGDQVPDGTSAVAENAASEGHDRRAVPRARELTGVTDLMSAKSGPPAIGQREPARVVVQHAQVHNATDPWGMVNNARRANAQESAHRKPCAKVEVQMRHASSGATGNATPAPSATWAEAPIAPASVAAKRKKKAWVMAASA